MSKVLTKESIPLMSDEDLNGILMRHARRGPYAWAVMIAEEVIAERRAERRRAPEAPDPVGVQPDPAAAKLVSECAELQEKYGDYELGDL